MKSTIEFNLPEDEADLKYALAGLDALLAIDDLLNEIRNCLKYGSGEFSKWHGEVYDEDKDVFVNTLVEGCPHTLERVASVLREIKENRKLPELI